MNMCLIWRAPVRVFGGFFGRVRTFTKRGWVRAVAFVLMASTFIGWPTAQEIAARRAMIGSFRPDSRFHLEEFLGGKVLSRVPISSEEIRRAIPVVPDLGMPGLKYLCYIPRHRVVIESTAGLRTTFGVCFTCDMCGPPGREAIPTPYIWRLTLRRLFQAHQVPIRGAAEYSRLRVFAAESKEQP